MSWHKEIWTYLIVTLVAVLIWAWAASETRERKTIPSVRVQFYVNSDAANWLIDPPTVSPSLNIEGTKLAVQSLAKELQKPIRIAVAVNAGHLTVNLAEALQQHEAVLKTGATIVSTEPATIDLVLDQVDQVRARVKPVLTGVTPEGEVVAQPADVTVSLPRSIRQRLPQDFTVEAFVERGSLDQLDPGVPQSLDNVSLRLPEILGLADNVRITPAKVKLAFTIRSRIRETTVESVRVQIGGPVEDRDSFVVEVDPKVLRNVTVLADADLSKDIESGEVPVIAIIHLSSREKESMVAAKPVSMFVALIPEMDGGTRYEQLKVKPGATMPVISLRITPRIPQQ